MTTLTLTQKLVIEDIRTIFNRPNLEVDGSLLDSLELASRSFVTLAKNARDDFFDESEYERKLVESVGKSLSIIRVLVSDRFAQEEQNYILENQLEYFNRVNVALSQKNGRIDFIKLLLDDLDLHKLSEDDRNYLIIFRIVCFSLSIRKKGSTRHLYGK